MTAKVIQGSFLGGQPKRPSSVQPKIAPSPFQARTAPASAKRAQPIQRHGTGGAFAVEAGPLGLVSSGGRPLPEGLRGKMEAALGADFSTVRVHVGPQAERIGAIAFTIGSDLYFAPGRYQPDTIQGQQLLGHELAHVVQQRQGRVRNPLGGGVAVVQDRALEAEADRLGQRAATHPLAAQAKLAGSARPSAPVAAQPSAPVRISAPVSAGPGSYRLTAGTGGREIGSVMVHARNRGAVEITDLGVDQSERGHGVGRLLLASAAKTGLQSGRSKMTLAAQDGGSGHLTRWYKEMGFTQTGVNQRGYPQLEAPISRVLAGAVQRQQIGRAAHIPGISRAVGSGRPATRFPGQGRIFLAGNRSAGRSTIQPMLSYLSATVKEYHYGLTEEERTRIEKGQKIYLEYIPIKGGFTVQNLEADLHVGAAAAGQNVGGKFKIVLKKVKSMMEYGANIHKKNVQNATITMRPTGGVVVKQMIELVAFLGRGFFEKMELNAGLDELKKHRKERVAAANKKINDLKQERDRFLLRLRKTGGDTILELIKQHPNVADKPSPGMWELIKEAEKLRDDVDRNNQKIKELISFTGERQGESLGEAFYDEHLYLIKSLIGRGKPGYFTVTAPGLANQLSENDPHLMDILANENALLLATAAGEKTRKMYANRLLQGMASLKITIFYSAINDLLGLIPNS